MKNYFCFSFFWICASALFFNSCAKESNWEHESALLVTQSLLLNEKYAALNQRVDSLWDATSQQLEKNMPSGVPPVDRDIFLNSRNAYHIRMFDSFELLDPASQQLIINADEYDKKLAREMQLLYEEKKKIEKLKNIFLRKVAESDNKASLAFAHKFRSNESTTARYRSTDHQTK